MSTLDFRSCLSKQIEHGNLTNRINSLSDLFAIAVHTCITSAMDGYALVTVNETQQGSQQHTQQYLPENWHSSTTGCHVFVYNNTTTKSTLTLKLVELGPYMIGHTLIDKSLAHHTFTISQLLNPNTTFPLSEINTSTVLITEDDSVVSSFLSAVKHLILQTKNTSNQQNVPDPDSSMIEPSSKHVKTSTLHHMKQPPMPAIPPVGGFVSPYSIGHSDLDPLGGARPVIGTPFGQNPIQAHPFNNDGGGSIMGPNHPLFSGQHHHHQPDEFGASSFLPQGSVPPGARFDPIVPVRPPLSFPGHSGAAPNNPSLFYSGDPDNDAFMPPGRPTGTNFPRNGARGGGGGGAGFSGNMFM